MAVSMSSALDYQITGLSPKDFPNYENRRPGGIIACFAGSPRNSCLAPIVLEPDRGYASIRQTEQHTMARRQFCTTHAKEFAEHHELKLSALNKPADPPTTEVAARTD
jgi:hypothetical protein